MNKKQLFENFEKNWGRFLTPFEIEDINKWIDEDGFPVDVVNEALRQTVVFNVKNLHYLNRVLSNWKLNNIMTVEAVKYNEQQRQEQRNQQLQQKATQNYTQRPQQKQPKQTNVPEWTEKDYKHEATAEEQAQLEALKKSMSED